MNQIEKTRDYNKFHKLLGNRPIDKGNIKRLEKAIEKDNQLNLHPIIVNGDFEIIDGQHRLEVAKRLNLEIFYLKSEQVTDDHMIEANVNQKVFEVTNYIDYFAIRERKSDYIQLKEMIHTTGLKPKALLTLILGSVNSSLLDFLKTGKFKFPTKEEPLEIINFYFDFSAYVNDKRITPFTMFTNHNFTRALRWLSKTTGFSQEIFFKKLDLRWFDLKPQRTSENWYELLLNIYNYKNQTRIEDEYTKKV